MTCPTRKPITTLLAGPELLNDVRVLRDHLVHDRSERTGVGHLTQAEPVDDRGDAVAGLHRILQRLLRPRPGDRVVGDQPDQLGQMLGRDAGLAGVHAVLVQQAGQILRDPVRRGLGVDPRCDRSFEQIGRRAVGDKHARNLGLEAELGRVALAPDARQLRQRRADIVDPRVRRLDRRDVRLREVAVVERLLLRAHRLGGAGVLIPVARLLHDRLAVVDRLGLPLRSRSSAHAPSSGRSSCS